MKFLLVYPETPDTYWSYRYALPFVGKKALMPPLGLATIAAMIPRDIDLRIIDLNVESLSDDEVAAADLVLASAMIVQRESLDALIARCNAVGTQIAVGGPHATSCPDQLPGADYLVLGEGEVSFPEFLADYLEHAADGAEAATTHRCGESTVRRVYRSDGRPDITTTPVPRFDLLNMHWYDTIPLQFSRGCPFDCEFCDIVQLFGHKPRTKRPAQFVREMDAAYATGFTGSLFVVDDNFIGNRRAVKELLRELAVWQRDRGYPYKLSTEASIDLAEDPELLDLMVDAGFGMVFVGIESPVADSLAAIGKKQNLRNDIATSIRTIQERGIDVTGGFIIGFDSDPPDIFDLQIDFVQELAIPTAMIGLLMALPNTKLYERLDREGRILSESNGNNTHATLVNFVSHIPAAQLEDGYRRVLESVYNPRRYFARCLDLLKRFPKRSDIPAAAPKIRLRELKGLIHSLLRQTFSRYGLSYLRYIILGIARRPSLMVRVVTYAVIGHHYFTMTKKMVRKFAAYAQVGKRAERPTTEAAPADRPAAAVAHSLAPSAVAYDSAP